MACLIPNRTDHRKFMVRTATIYRHQAERAKKAGAALDYALADLRRGVEAAVTGDGCLYCRVPLSPETFSIDHMQPTSRGGPWGLDNLASVCTPCNEAKGHLTAAEYQGLLSLMGGWEPKSKEWTLRRLRIGGRILGGGRRRR